jgi:hypothetical protein
MSKDKRRRSRSSSGKRKPYRVPELTVHGDLSALTRSKKGKTNDGFGKPKTRVSIFNA